MLNMTAFVANTNLLELIGLRSEVEDAYINNATVTVTINGPNGDAISGETWPLAMSYVTASDGDYRATLLHTLPLIANQQYVAVIEANGGANRVGHWEFPFRPAVRQAT
jgi:hypothetical protein